MIRERDDELNLLRELLTELDPTGGRLVLVRGQAGIGKSTLVGEFLSASESEAHVLEGACDDLLTPQPLAPIWDLARTEPALANALASGDRRAVMDGLLDLLGRRQRPTVLVIEDTHWADEATLDVIRFLGRRISRTNALLMLTYRTGEVDAGHPLRQVIGDLPPRDLVRIQLDPLSPRAVATMIEDTDLDLADVLALTGANPLFVTELVSSVDDHLPSSIHDVVVARASRLSAEARSVLDLVSIVPGEAERTLVDQALGPSDAALQECERHGLVTFDDTTVSFTHELTRRAIETSLSPPDRQALNERVLSVLGRQGDPARLVHHARQADDVEAIVELAPKAARAAMTIESHREALAHFSALHPYLDHVPAHDRAAILDDWVQVDYLAGVGEGPPNLMDRAIELRRSLDDDVALARLLAFAVRFYEMDRHPERSAACAEEAVSILESHPPSADLAFAINQRAWLSFMRGEEAEGSRQSTRALAIAEEVGDDLIRVQALITKGGCDYSLGDQRAVALVEDAHRLAQQHGFRVEETSALINLTGMAGDVRDLGRAEDLAQRTIETARRFELRPLETYVRAQYAEILMWKGQWDAAEDEATEVLDMADAHAEPVARRILGLIEARRGRSGADELLDRAFAAADASRELQHLDPAAGALAEYAWLSNNAVEPSRIQEVFDRGVRTGPPWPSEAFAFWWWKAGRSDVVPEGLVPVYGAIFGGRWRDAAEF